jgi:asparagine synthase (glutamine-hydrolysing)
MCGIAGFRSDRGVAEGALHRMIEALHHRGPDDDGYFSDGPFRGAMRRLAINDVAGGHQPLFNADRSVALLYNGEIYNYLELRRWLEAKGHRFRTRSDGEVICHLYEHHGEDLFERLDGMFAAALWVAPERKLILARDIPGEKPLYYSELREGTLAFASEITAFRGFPGLDLELDRQAIWDFPTFLWIPEPATVYRNIRALPRGHVLVADDHGIRVKAYENRFNREPLARHDAPTVIAETRRVVENAVKSRLLSDVPVGSFLSGGLDSSIVATVAARELETLDTFSVGFEDVADPYHGRADESAAAEATARRIGSRHHSIHVTARSFRNELDRFCRHGDQPFAISSGLGILAVARAAREHGIKVLLSGDGADECFGGYSWYPHLRKTAGAVDGAKAWPGILSFQNFGIPLSDRLAAIAALPDDAKAWAWHYYAHEEEKAALFTADFRDGLSSSLRFFRGYRDGPWQPVDFIAQDRDFYFPNEMLRKVDRMAMAYSVEGRVPFAAPAVLSHAAKLDFADMVGTDGTLKWALRRAFTDILPAEVVGRAKHGFNVPIDHWLKHEWADLLDEAFAPESALSRSGIVASGAGQMARAMLHDRLRLNGHTVFCMIMLNAWLERSHDGNHCRDRTEP